MKCFGITDIGKKRSVNQDCFGIKKLSDDIYIIAAFDGMGGANGGEVASSTAMQCFFELCEAELANGCSDEDFTSVLYNAVAAANEKVYRLSLTSPELSGMGTTLVAAILCANNGCHDSIDADVKTYCPAGEPASVSVPTENEPTAPSTEAFISNVGDSRAYLYCGGELTQLTKDHSYVQYLVDNGEISSSRAARHPQRNIIMKAIGIESTVLPDVQTKIIPEGACIMLVSDGLYSEARPSEIKRILGSKKSLEEKAEALVRLANRRGGHDNITVVLAEI